MTDSSHTSSSDTSMTMSAESGMYLVSSDDEVVVTDSSGEEEEEEEEEDSPGEESKDDSAFIHSSPNSPRYHYVNHCCVKSFHLFSRNYKK